MLKVLRLIFTFMLVLTAAGVNAQVTTSAISGKVTDEQNETVIGATIVAVHEPSGTQYGAITNVDGRYTIQGMRTGGPYKLTVSYVGYQSAVFTGIMLELGNTYTQNVKLHPSSELLDEVVVVADAKTQSGAATNFSANSIENTPTVDRNIYDIVKNSPLAMTSKNGGITFVGSNNRYNSFQIDGGQRRVRSFCRWHERCSDRRQSYFYGCHSGNSSSGGSLRRSPKRIYGRRYQRHHQAGYERNPRFRLHLFQQPEYVWQV